MNLLLIEADELGDDAVVHLRAPDRRVRHAREVLRVGPGDELRVGILHGATGVARVAEITAENLTLEVRCDAASAPRPIVDLVLAVPRPKALRRVLQSAAAMGVGRIDLVNAWRVEKSYFQSPWLAPEALRRELLLGCEQGATTWLPQVAVHPLLMPFVEGQLDGDDDRVRVLLHPRADTPLEAAVAPGAGPRVCASIGPEGGWIDRELETFEARGFHAVAMGARVLRVETAVTALLAQVELLRRL